MRTKLKKWHLVLMSFIALFIAVFASLFSLKADTVDEEQTPEELTENWTMDIVFYDSTVDNGKTPLTEIDWDATIDTHSQGQPRVITVQLNYKNTNAVTTYQPGELRINLKRLIATTKTDFSWGRYLDENNNNYFSYFNVTTVVGANDATHTGYKWDLVNTDTNNWIFSNAEIIEEKANFEGSIQVQYTITPSSYIPRDPTCKQLYASHEAEINAFIPDVITSNNISFKYERTYSYEWEYREFQITKTASKLSSLDGLPQGDYYWVKYNLSASPLSGSATYTSYPYIGASLCIKDEFPAECVVLNSSQQPIEHENNVYSFNSTSVSLYVGYPKSIYNEEAGTLMVTNHADLYAQYDDSDEYVFAADAEITINLADFQFVYSGNLYGISKRFINEYNSKTGKPILCYEALTGQDLNIGGGGNTYANIAPSAIYTGKAMDIKFGDDLLYISDSNNGYRKLNDDEYYFTSVYFSNVKNGNNISFPKDKYNAELWVRYSGDTEYTLYEEFKYGNKTSWSFTADQAIVGYYFITKNVTESFILQSSNNSSNATIKVCNAKDIAEKGYVYNFAYIQVYINGVLQNEPGLDSYANLITKEEIATFDQSTYGTYMQRAYARVSYDKFEFPEPSYSFPLKKTMTSPIQDAANEKFTGTINLALTWGKNYSQSDYVIETYGKDAPLDKKLTGWEFFDLVPEGMTITDTPEEIIENMYTLIIPYYDATQYKIWNKDGVRITDVEFGEILKRNTTIEFTYNWRDTNRTYIYIKIDLTQEPIFFFAGRTYDVLSIPINYEITYDSYLEYGSTYNNYLFAQYLGKDFDKTKSYFDFESVNTMDEITDNGKLDPETSDINNNGKTNETISYDGASIKITSIISTHQDVTKYVKSSTGTFSTGIVDVPNNDEYQYKLRARTGNANVTNLILYDVLEAAQPERTRWTGEFLGIDTSFAEERVYKLYKPNDPNADSNGYISYNIKVNTFTSEDPDAGNLYLEDGTFNSKYKEYVAESTYVNGLEIKFSEDSKAESSDLFQIYYNYEGKTYYLPAIRGNQFAGQVVQVPSNDFYIRWYTDYSICNYYGFSIESITHKDVPFTGTSTTTLDLQNVVEFEGDNYPDSNWDGNHPHGNYGNNINQTMHYTYTGEKQVITQGTDKSKVKSIAFEFVNDDGTPAILPANNLTYVLINMKAPADENITTLARNDCRTQWNALDDFDRPVDFVTGINSNVVKVALPNSIKTDDVAKISLKFTKEIQGTNTQFENMKLNKADSQTFMIRLTSLTENEDGTYNQVTALLKSNQELIISQIPVGTYLLEELNDNYFDFVDFEENNEEDIVINGVTFERTDQGYILTVSEDLTENVEFNIKVTNEIEPFRPYEDKDNKENLFLKNKINDNIIDPDDPEGH